MNEVRERIPTNTSRFTFGLVSLTPLQFLDGWHSLVHGSHGHGLRQIIH